MSLSEPLLIQKLHAKSSYLSERQTILARNIANIDTPGYHAQDLKKLDFNAMLDHSGQKLAMTTTSIKHIAPATADSHFAIESKTDTTGQKPGGNNVILEEQMGHVSDVNIQHQMTTALLKKFHQLYRTAVESKAS